MDESSPPPPSIYSARQLATLHLDHSRSVDALNRYDREDLRRDTSWEIEIMMLPDVRPACSNLTMPESRKEHRCDCCSQLAAVPGEYYVKVQRGASYSDYGKYCLFCAWSLFGASAFKPSLLPATEWLADSQVGRYHAGSCGRGCLVDARG